MFKKAFFIYFILICSFIKAQTDSSAIIQATPRSETLPKSKQPKQETPSVGSLFKPKISLGVGMLSFHGDLYAKHFQAPWTARIGYDLNISQRLSKSLQLNFNVLFGKLGANEWVDKRQENFQSEIRSGGLSLLYDFGNFIPEKSRVRPWVSIGINSFEFLSKTDLTNIKGDKYYYWSDGSIKNMDESAPTASLAVNLNRDYIYETDIRELNKDGFGKYQEQALAFPFGAGVLMKVTDRFDVKIGVQYYFTTTDYVDGISSKSIGTRIGTKQKDNFVYTSFALQYDLVLRKKSKGDTLPDDYFDSVDWLAIDNGDFDEDGVKDWKDRCHGTPKGVKVDSVGCPFDDDTDGVANYADDELASPAGVAVNMKGVALTDDYWQNWYNQYMDSGMNVKTEIIENFYATKKNPNVNKNNEVYTVVLARYAGPVPNEEMAYLLSIGDVMSTILPDNTTVLYTAGTYKEIQNAVKRRDEFKAQGNKNAEVGYFQKGNLISLSDEDINKLAQTTNTTKTTQESKIDDEEDASANEFGKDDIVYRVQLGAYKNRISKEIFKNAGKVVELKTDGDVYRYATKGFKTMQGAANLKATLLMEGYGDAFITAYKDGKRIAMNTTGATMETTEKEDISKLESFSSIDKSLVTFKVQLGVIRKSGSNEMDEKTKDLSGVEKQTTSSGLIRYTVGSFNDYAKADKYRQEVVGKGFGEAFIIAFFKGEIISIQEAQELLK